MLHVHARKVLGAGDVSHPEGVPQHDVPTFLPAQRSISLGPCGKTLTRGALGGELTGGEALRVGVGRHPKVLGGKRTLGCHRALGTGEQHGLRPAARERHELIPDRFGRDGVDDGWVGDSPCSRLGLVADADRAALGGESGLHGTEGVGKRIADARRLSDAPGDEVHLFHDVVSAVHRDVEPGAEHVLVHLCVYPRRDQHAVLGSSVAVAALAVDPLAGGEKVGGKHPGELDLVFHASVLVEVPVEEVLVVHHRGDERDHEPAGSASLVVPVAVLHVFPQHPHVLLVHANRLLDDVRLALRVAKRRVEVTDAAEAIAPQLQRVCAVSQPVIAHVEGALALEGRVRVRVRHGHLHQTRPFHDGSALERRVVNNETLAVVETQAHAPLVPPNESSLGHRKVGAVGLYDVERFHRRPVLGGQVRVGTQRRAVVVDVRLETNLRGGRAGLPGAVDHLPGVKVHHR